jgi:BirA family biotin operon repressor/biotin-[acetyl-CoA-carboxylase] ligase
VTSEEVLDAQARLLQKLGAGARSLNLRDPSLARELGEPLEPAIRALEEAGLVLLGGDGILRPGARGSLLSGVEIEASFLKTGHRVEIHSSVSSTNELALERARSGELPGLVIVAERQTAGRGRRGRGFASAPGLGVWSTTLLDPPSDPELAPRLSLVAAIAVARAVEAETGVRPGVKWPNDVRIEGRKICGILVEARTRGAALFAVAGIGVNVHHRLEEFPVEIRNQAGSVEALTRARVERGRLLVRIVGELHELLAAGDSLDLPERFAPFDEMRDRDVTVHLGDRLWRGVAAGIEDDGSFRLAVPGGETRVFRSGDASLRAREG